MKRLGKCNIFLCSPFPYERKRNLDGYIYVGKGESKRNVLAAVIKAYQLLISQYLRIPAVVSFLQKIPEYDDYDTEKGSNPPGIDIGSGERTRAL
ncbi:hypothetical protein CEXT_661521 [Caerostris extrusa]|uniref:Uncharacterized protein n=1 Tax=Caerostris extrusa TaxID=172846 RepID=A0AAV4PPT7_CAEEX|nr:hypothetical protein CEXT_661521 [Caerostris extrusa]